MMLHLFDPPVLQLALIVCLARLFGTVATRLGQARVVGEIIAGMALVPLASFTLNPSWRDALFGSAGDHLRTLGEIGVIFLMFQAGLSFEADHLGQPVNRKTTLVVAATGMLVPVFLGAALGAWSAPELAPGYAFWPYTLFCGIALAISAVPVMTRIAQELGIEGTPACTMALAAAAATDVFGWIALALVSAFSSGAGVQAIVANRLGSLILLLTVCTLVLRPACKALSRRLDLAGEWGGGHCIAFAIVVALCLAFWTNAIGLHSVFGAFLAGILLGQDKRIAEAWRRDAETFVGTALVTVFFATSGMKLDVTPILITGGGVWIGAFLAAAVLGKLGACYVAGRLAGLRHGDAVVVASLLNTRGLMEIVVLTVGLELGIIPASVYSILLVVTVATTLMTAPLLRMQRKYGGRRGEHHVVLNQNAGDAASPSPASVEI